MAQMNMIQALNSAMDVMMARDPSVVVMGEDVGYFGGVFRVTDGLQRKYGDQRVLDSPISEGGIVATAIGMAVNGLKPVAEIQFADYIYPAVDQIASELARIRYRSAGDFSSPVVIRAPCGGGIRGGQTHSQSPEAIFTHICGVKVVMPSNPYDAKGLLIAAIEDDDPIIFFEPKRIYNGPFDGDPNKPAVPWSTHAKGNVPEGHYKVPIGKCDIVRPGEQVTIVTYGTMVYVCEAAAKKLNIDAEIIDVRTMSPLDIDPICSSVKKTGRCVIAHEATRFSGFGAELCASIQEECFWYLEAPIQRVAGWDTPYPHAFEWEYFPGQARVALALRAAMGRSERGNYMSRYVFKMPDLGEGTVSAEVVAWHVKPGDLVQEDQVMCEVMTEKAAVEMPAPVTGRILSIQGAPGDMVAVGSELVVFDTDATSAAAGDAPAAKTPPPAPAAKQPGEKQQIAAAAATNGANGNGDGKSSRVMVSPASRRRAAEAGLDLSTVAGTGPAGRIEPGDIDSALAAGAARGAPPSINARANAPHEPRNGTEEVKIIGLRRVIAERLTESARSIPQYSYVEECDLTRLEGLRKHLNDRRPPSAPPLTFLPFIVAALARVLDKFPQCNALYDSTRGVLVKHKAVHVGVATQTPQGLKVPVVRNAESRALHDLAAEIRRVAEAARTNKSPREELTGSTITITSLGKLGGIASTPMINMPEVSIIGINKAIERAVVVDGQICVRLMMNLSSSFDHRFVDGFDAASMIQALKDSLEQPATIFID